MASTYEPIATTTLGSSQSSVTFGSGGTISQAYTDLFLVFTAKQTGTSNVNIKMTFNSDTGSNYSMTRLYGNGSTASSDRVTSQNNFEVGYPGGSSTPSIYALSTINIMNYSNTTTYKSFISRWGNVGTSDSYTLTQVGLWRSTSAITSITLAPVSNSFDSGSTFTLYGIKAA
jgi:hypothetical protein